MNNLKAPQAFDFCPKTGKPIKRQSKSRWMLWLLPITGLSALIWFLIRVVPKPSRAAYPCQQVAAPLASGFVVWLLGLIGSAVLYSKIKRLFHQPKYVIWTACAVVALVAVIWPISTSNSLSATTSNFVPTDPPNTPMGTARGIKPGRVVWVFDPALTDATGTTNDWWSDTHTNPKEAHTMMSRAIRSVAGIPNQADAWDAIFRNFNLTHHGINQGYVPGEKIAIKVNLIFSHTYAWSPCLALNNMPNPQMLYALLWQLIKVAGVPDSDITVYDCAFYIGDPIYNYCHTDFPGVTFAEGDATDRYPAGPGPNPGARVKVFANMNDANAIIYYSDANVPYSGQARIPDLVVKAKYFINIALPRKHDLAGVTLCGKNHFGSVWHPNSYYYHGFEPANMHYQVAAYTYDVGAPHNQHCTMRPMNSYTPLVDLMGHKQMGGKTLLYMVEFLWQYKFSYAPFNNDWPSSIFVSQDGVAVDSVVVDFLRSGGVVPDGTVDNYLHEAATANAPLSGTFYDPEHDGTRMASLGVHEHWNNSTNKQYSRNLGTGNGIELVQSLITNVTPGDFEPDGDVDFDDLIVLISHWLDVNQPGCIGDLTGDCKVKLDDFAIFAKNWASSI